jgi:hypothetical protein
MSIEVIFFQDWSGGELMVAAIGDLGGEFCNQLPVHSSAGNSGFQMNKKLLKKGWELYSSYGSSAGKKDNGPLFIKNGWLQPDVSAGSFSPTTLCKYFLLALSLSGTHLILIRW